MAKWREESGKSIKDAEEKPRNAPEEEPTAKTTATSETTDPGRRRTGHRARPRDGGNGLRTGLRRVCDTAADVVRLGAMIICVLLALHIAFVVFSANHDNAIVRTVDDGADWFAWQFRDIFVPKDERVGVLVNYGIAAVVYLIAGRVVGGLFRRIR
jgi:hypothetical protein